MFRPKTDTINGILSDFYTLKDRLGTFIEKSQTEIDETETKLAALKADTEQAKASLQGVKSILGESE